MLQRCFPIIAAALISLLLAACTNGVGNLNTYVDASDGYQFAYPNGWVQVEVRDASEGVDVVFRDIIERSENVSVIISDVPSGKRLQDLGTPTEVGYRFLKATNSGEKRSETRPERDVEFISAAEHRQGEQTYYELEYEVGFPDRSRRHNLASVVVSHGRLFTFNVSTSQARWEQVEPMFRAIAQSFQVS